MRLDQSKKTYDKQLKRIYSDYKKDDGRKNI